MLAEKPAISSLPVLLVYICLLIITPAGSWQSNPVTDIKGCFSKPAKRPAVQVMFNDSRLEFAVRNALGKPGGNIEETDMAGLTELYIQNDSIANLTGLEYAINLQKLILDHNRIIDLAPLQNLTALSTLSLGYNRIANLEPLAGLVNLVSLSLKFNQIIDILALQNLVNLSGLELQDNKITDISALQAMSALTTLNLNNCKVVDLTPVQNLRALIGLRLLDNKITDIIPLQNLTALRELYLSRNRINDFLPLLKLTNLEILYLTETGIADLSVLQNMTALQKLYIANNHISDLTPLQSLTTLKTLECYNNIITLLAGVQDLTDLQTLNAAHNRLGSFAPIASLPALKRLDISFNKFKDLVSLPALPFLETLYLDNNFLDHGDLPALYPLDKLKTLRMRNNPGMISGTAVQTLVDNLDKLDCEDILWEGLCGIDPNAAAICWVDPDTANINELVTVHITATDTNQSRIQTRIDWDDNVISEYSKFEENASVFTLTYSYTQAGYYHIRGMAKNEGGKETPWSSSVSIVILDNGSAIHQADQLACEFSLAQNYPNPFNATTAIHYTLPRNGHVTLRIFNLAGQEIDCPLNSIQTAGEHTIIWQGRTGAGQSVPSGIYIYQVATDSFTRNRKMILLR